MKRYLLAFLVILAPLVRVYGANDNFQFSDFHCGVDTYHSPLSLQDCFVSDGLNVFFDKQAGVTKRNGYTTFASSNSYQFTGLWSYTDSTASGYTWMVARASDSIVATTGIGTSNFNIKIATVASANVVAAVVAQGNIYFVDQTQGVYFWNGTSTTYVASSPLGSCIASFHGRLWVGCLATPNGQNFYGSAYLNGQSWTTSSVLSGVVTDPVLYTVNLKDSFDKITGFFAGLNDALYIFEQFEIDALYGFDQSDFGIRQITKDAGCIDQFSIQPFLGTIVFASARGIESFNGYSPTRISDNIRDKIDPITLNGQFNLHSWTHDSQTDWQTGTIVPTANLSATLNPGSLVVSSFSQTDDTQTEFSAGTQSNSHVTTSAGLTLGYSIGSVASSENLSFETGDLTGWSQSNTSGDSWSVVPCAATGGSFCSSLTSCSGTYAVKIADTHFITCNTYAQIVDVSTNVLVSAFMSRPGTCDLYTDARTVSGDASLLNKKVRLRFKFDCGGSGVSYLYSAQPVLCANNGNIGGSPATITCGFFVPHTGGGSQPEFYIDYIQGGENFKNLITSATYTSQAFNTGVTSSTVQLQAGWTVTTTTPYMELQHSVNGSSNWLKLTSSTGTNVVANQYLRYVSSITPTNEEDGKTVVTSVSLLAKSSGTFNSTSLNVSTMTSFGNFLVHQDFTQGGTIAFSVCSANNSSMTGKTCTATSPNSAISVSTNIFVSVIATFTVVSATETPTLNDFTIQWYTGTRKPPMASAVYDNRYWLSATTDTVDSTNDATLVLSKGPTWSIFDIKAGAMTIWKNQIYHADALATGYVYQDNQNFSDNGVAINAFVKTRDFAPKGWLDLKYFDALYFAEENMGGYNTNASYFVDASTYSFTLSSFLDNEHFGRLYAKAPFPLKSSQQQTGRSIMFKFQEADLNGPWRFLGGYLTFKKRTTL